MTLEAHSKRPGESRNLPNTHGLPAKRHGHWLPKLITPPERVNKSSRYCCSQSNGIATTRLFRAATVTTDEARQERRWNLTDSDGLLGERVVSVTLPCGGGSLRERVMAQSRSSFSGDKCRESAELAAGEASPCSYPQIGHHPVTHPGVHAAVLSLRGHKHRQMLGCVAHQLRRRRQYVRV